MMSSVQISLENDFWPFLSRYPAPWPASLRNSPHKVSVSVYVTRACIALLVWAPTTFEQRLPTFGPSSNFHALLAARASPPDPRGAPNRQIYLLFIEKTPESAPKSTHKPVWRQCSQARKTMQPSWSGGCRWSALFSCLVARRLSLALLNRWATHQLSTTRPRAGPSLICSPST